MDFYAGSGTASLAQVVVTQEPVPTCYLVAGTDAGDDSKVLPDVIDIKGGTSMVCTVVTNCSAFSVECIPSWCTVERLGGNQIRISAYEGSGTLRSDHHFNIFVNNKYFNFTIRETDSAPDYGDGEEGYIYGPAIDLQ